VEASSTEIGEEHNTEGAGNTNPIQENLLRHE
jgi:hypothetical protein